VLGRIFSHPVDSGKDLGESTGNFLVSLNISICTWIWFQSMGGNQKGRRTKSLPFEKHKSQVT
jgi:hypothetical protein